MIYSVSTLEMKLSTSCIPPGNTVSQLSPRKCLMLFKMTGSPLLALRRFFLDSRSLSICCAASLFSSVTTSDLTLSYSRFRNCQAFHSGHLLSSFYARHRRWHPAPLPAVPETEDCWKWRAHRTLPLSILQFPLSTKHSLSFRTRRFHAWINVKSTSYTAHCKQYPNILYRSNGRSIQMRRFEQHLTQVRLIFV